ncbi:MAG: NADPH:quinone oxidoreductase family protein [Frankia sp.]|nr:NADPH:quinone oxidoreductase family protein [Frankia sp.]
MRAALCREYGSPDVVRVEEVRLPEPGPGEVRVRVGAAAVNFPDVLLIANRYQMTVPTPFVPGSEFAGVVDAVGDGAVDGTGRPLAVGDRVFGTTMIGAFAEQVVVGGSSVRPVPAGVDDAAAAAFGVAHRTAMYALRTVGGLAAGQRLVVLGAGGGVGLAAVQLGAVLGAEVVAVASADDKLAVAAANGASILINYRERDLRSALRAEVPDGVDLVVDPVGGALSEPALRALRFGGRFVTVGFASGEIPRIPLNLVLLKGAHVLGFQMRDIMAHLAAEAERDDAELTDLLAAGRVRPHIGATFPLDDVVAALRHVGDGKAIGKTVLTLAG